MKKTLSLFFVAIAFLLGFSSSAMAAEYNEFLRKGLSHEGKAITHESYTDLNNDGSDELFLIDDNFISSSFELYTIKNDVVVYCGRYTIPGLSSKHEILFTPKNVLFYFTKKKECYGLIFNGSALQKKYYLKTIRKKGKVTYKYGTTKAKAKKVSKKKALKMQRKYGFNREIYMMEFFDFDRAYYTY